MQGDEQELRALWIFHIFAPVHIFSNIRPVLLRVNYLESLDKRCDEKT